MKFPNVAFAADERGLAQYQLATVAGMSESRLSRCMNARMEFTPRERSRIAEALGFDEAWLFERPKPPTQIKELISNDSVAERNFGSDCAQAVRCGALASIESKPKV